MLDIQAEQHDQGQPLQEIYEVVADLKRRHDLHPCSVRPRDGLALRKESERAVVQDLVSRFRRLPLDQQRRLPALLNSLAQLQVVIGDLEAGQNDFQEVARQVTDPISRAEAHHNVYRIALERRDWNEALTALQRAVALDPDTFEPFPFARYEPQRILGAGGFGVSFLCEEKPSTSSEVAPISLLPTSSEVAPISLLPTSSEVAPISLLPTSSEVAPISLRSGSLVVVKALRTDSLDRDIETIFREIHSLQDLDHIAFIRVRECGGTSVEPHRPYLVLDYFDGLTLADHVARHGPLAPEDWLQIAWPLARALQGAHGRGVLHRSLRPGCVLIRREMVPVQEGDVPPDSEIGPEEPNIPETDPGEETPEVSKPAPVPMFRWRVKMLDAALSLKRSLIHASASHPEARAQTTLGRSVARTIAYAPSEVIARPKGQVWVGPHSDIFSFGKLSAFALTGRADPDGGDLLLLAEPWRQLLSACTAWVQSARPAHFGLVLERLALVPGADDIIGKIERLQFEDIVAEHTAALDADPTNLTARIARANAYARQGEHAKAIADFTQALEACPEDAALYGRRAHARSRAGDLDGAIADFSEAIRLNPRDADAHISRGVAYSQKQAYDQAIADYSEGLRINPRDEILYFNRGNAHYCKGDHERAIADYSEAIRLNGQNLWAFGNRGKAHQQRGDQAKAIADYTRVLQLDPANLKALYDRALAYSNQGRHERAIADYTEALRLDPSPTLYHDRAQAHLSAGDVDSALADLNEALTQAPDHLPALLTRANLLADLDRLDQALADLDEAVRLAPESLGALINRGNVRARLGQHDLAIADFSSTLALQPRYAVGLFNRGNSYAAGGDYDRAIADYSAALEIEPDDEMICRNRGNAYLALGDIEQALADFTQALAIDPGDTQTRCTRASTLLRQGDLDQALSDYTIALEHDPQSARAYTGRAQVHSLRGDSDAALADLDQAIKFAPDFARAWLNRGNVRAERGDLDQAIADYTEAIRLQPDSSIAWFNRAIAYAERKDHTQAIDDFSEAIRLQPNNAAALNNRANTRLRVGDRPGALADFTAAIAADPNFAMSYYNRANLLCDEGDYEAALADFTESLRIDPDDLTSYLNRGRVYTLLNRSAEAIADNLAALERSPDDARICNNLAWLWATSSNPEVRNPQKALEYARKACATGEDAGRLDTLAAAYAACGQFEEAIRQQERALELASEADKADFQSRLDLYREGKSFLKE